MESDLQITTKHSLNDDDDNDHPKSIPMHVLDSENKDTGKIENINLSKIYSFTCLCGQSRLMCSLINPMCNEYCCSNKNRCPDCGEIKLIPKTQEAPKNCLKCGHKMVLLNDNSRKN